MAVDHSRGPGAEPLVRGTLTVNLSLLASYNFAQPQQAEKICLSRKIWLSRQKKNAADVFLIY